MKSCLLFLFKEWKEEQLGNLFLSLFPSENSLLKGENKGKTLLNLLSIPTREPLMIEHCLDISLSSKRW